MGVATQPRNTVHSPQSLGFPLKAVEEDMLQLLTVAQILPTGCAKSVHGCVSLTATLPSNMQREELSGSCYTILITCALTPPSSWSEPWIEKGFGIKAFLPLSPASLYRYVHTHLLLHVCTHRCTHTNTRLKEQGPMQNHQGMPILTLTKLHLVSNQATSEKQECCVLIIQ